MCLDYGLRTEPDEQDWLGVHEARLTLDQLFADAVTGPAVRDTKLQTISSIQLSFVCGLRVGSQVPSYHEEVDNLNKVRDLIVSHRLQSLSYGCFRASVTRT